MAISSLTTRPLAGWGRYRPADCAVASGHSVDAVRRAVVNGRDDESQPTAPVPLIARGLGRSYGDPAVIEGGAVLQMPPLDRLIRFDPSTGVLETEAGVSIETVLDVFLPRGWFPLVTPGTKFVTLGGAIAADVHGKNHHHDGAFSQCVDWFDLMLADGRIIRCSPTGDDFERQLFDATVGGMGLTGVILRAALRLRPVESSYINVSYQRAANLDEALDLFARGDEQFTYSVAWIDCLARGGSLGRSVLIRGDHASVADLPPRLAASPLPITHGAKASVPFDFPGFALNRWSVRAFNSLYYFKHADKTTLVDYDAFFYPLDSINHWNRIYGSRGFVQYQPVIPPESARDALVKMLEKITQAGAASFLAVLKTMGPENDGLLSFPRTGATLALDMPNTGSSLLELLSELDRIVLDHGGRVYLAKDAAMSAETFARMYPRLEAFRTVKQEVDPRMRFVSAQARRLGIV